MRTLVPSPFLRRVLLVDAAISVLAGAAMTLDAPALQALLRLPAALLAPAGAACLLYAAFLAWLATRERAPAAALWAPVVLNVLWALDCVAVGATMAPNAPGVGFLVAQALATLVLAELEFIGLRRSAAPMAA